MAQIACLPQDRAQHHVLLNKALIRHELFPALTFPLTGLPGLEQHGLDVTNPLLVPTPSSVT